MPDRRQGGVRARDERPQARRPRQVIDTGKCVAFVGSGLSNRQYPTWDLLIAHLCAECLQPGANSGLGLSDDQKLAVADRCRKSNPEGYRRVLDRDFGKTPTDLPRIYLRLARINFGGYVTTNFDPLMMESLKNELDGPAQVRVYPLLPLADLRRDTVFHLHGLIEPGQDVRPAEIVLGEEDFQAAYARESGRAYSFLDQLLTYHSCCFIGIGLQEQSLQRHLKKTKEAKGQMRIATSGRVEPSHFALRPMMLGPERKDGVARGRRDGAAEIAEERDFEALGISVVRYDAIDSDHSGLLALLEEWFPMPAINVERGFSMEVNDAPQ